MELVEELIQMLSSDDCNMGTALAKAQVLAHRLSASEMREWVLNESRGYSDASSVPDYRVVRCTVMGNASNEAYRSERTVLPVLHLDEKYKKQLTEKKVLQSISAIEQWTKNEDALTSRISPEMYPLLDKGLGNGYKLKVLGVKLPTVHSSRLSRKFALGSWTSFFSFPQRFPIFQSICSLVARST